MDDLTTTTGIAALAAGGVALLALIVAIVALVRLRRLRADQKRLLGTHGETDLVAHAAHLDREFAALHDYVEDALGRVHGRLDTAEARLEGAVAYRGLLRYDAYNEMSGRQSTTLALLDATRSGVVLSSIHHRDQARIYVKQVHAGEAELPLSPEEEEAMRIAVNPAEPAPG